MVPLPTGHPDGRHARSTWVRTRRSKSADGSLVGLGREVNRIVMVIPAVMRAWSGGRPRLAHDLQAFLEATLALFDGHAEMIEVTRMVANPESQNQATVGQQVDHRCLLGEVDRIIERWHDDIGA